MKKRSYCSNCQDSCEIKIIDNVEIREILKNKEYKYIGKKAICEKCQSEVFDFDTSDYNLEKLDDVYRKENHIIELEKIRELPERYNIGKRPLSDLLGLGEHTISRYIEGDTPSKRISDILVKVYEDPLYFFSILEKNRDKLTNVAYKKCKKQVGKIIENEGMDIICIVKYILKKLDDITNLSIQKLLYYSQGFSLVFNKRPMFVDNCEAWAKGPVFRRVYNEYKSNEKKLRQVEYELNIKNEDKIILDRVIDAFKDYSGFVLSEFTHLEEPWIKARKGLSDQDRSNEVISIDSIKEYFTNAVNEYNIVDLNDINKYSKAMYQKYKKISY